MRSFIGDCCETAVIEIEFFIFEEYPVLGRLVSTGFLFDNHLKQDIMLGYVLFLISIFIGSNLGSKANKDGMHNMREGVVVSLSALLGAMCIIILN